MTQDTELSPGLRFEPGVDFPLPPPELADQLMNEPPVQPGAALVKPSVASPAPSVAALDFVDGQPGVTIPLRYPFRWEGRLIQEIRVVPLPVAAIGPILNAGKGADNFDFYGAMTGLPAAVVRALPGEDGDAVTDAAYGFLPRFLKAADPGSPSTQGNGGS